MSAREGWSLCGWCGEPLGAAGDSGIVMNMPAHEECALRMILGGYNHLRGTCTCCGGPDPPDPPRLTKRQAAREAANFWMSRTEALLRAARQACHDCNIDWIDPTTGQRHPPP